MKIALFILLTQIGQHFGLPQDMLPAVAMVESEGNPRPPDSAWGAQGLMQLRPVAQRRFGVRDPYDPGQSAYGAARYLRWGFDHYKSWRLALGAYGCGPSHARRCRAYVAKVVDLMGYRPW